MNQAVNLRHFLAGGLILASALTCDAMSLGRTKGVIWIGQPLDVSIQVRLDPGEDVSAICVSADVLYGDSRVGSGQVRVVAEPGNTREEATVRIQSAALVDEPVVNIYLKAGCNQAMTRRYVLLAEVPVDYTTETAAPGIRAPSVPPAGRSDARPELGGLDSGRSTVPPVGRAGGAPIPRVAASASPADAMAAAIRRPAVSTEVARPVAAPAPVRSVVRKTSPDTVAGKSRLKLDPADLLIERDPVLRASAELLTTPQEQDASSRRAEAAALWRAINATPEEVLRDARRIQALQTDVTSLRSQAEKSEAAVAELRLRLQEAQAARYANGLVYFLIAMLVAVLGTGGYFWSRSRKQAKERQWWGMEGASTGTGEIPLEAGEASDEGKAEPAGLQGADLDIDLSAGASPSRSERPLPARPGLAPLDSGDFQSSLTGAGRAVKVEELLDVQQQADFFISLGQYDQAVATLRNHIADNVETSALAYLDLLKIYHLQGREKDYALVRKEFNDVFNAEVPEFTAFGQQTRGLQSYQSAMSRITDLWPTPKVLDVIEESIFRKPGQGRQVFDLEAYRELLMLYSIAKEIVEQGTPGPAFVSSGRGLLPSTEVSQSDVGESQAARPDFQATNIQPLPTAPLSTDNASPAALRVPPSANLGLDIDLSEFASDSAERPPTASPAPADERAPAGATKANPVDSHLIDFDIFDMATKAHAASKRGKP